MIAHPAADLSQLVEGRAGDVLEEPAKLLRGPARFLLRLPYGREAARAESFDFEEMPAGSPHESYLWGPGSVLCGLLLAEGFVESGWSFDPDDVRQVTGLPVHIYEDQGERAMKPCAEVMLAVADGRDLIGRGHHREAVFWIAVTYARCLATLASDAPAAAPGHLPGFSALLGDLGIASPADLGRRAGQVRGFLPRLGRVAEAILAANPDARD